MSETSETPIADKVISEGRSGVLAESVAQSGPKPKPGQPPRPTTEIPDPLAELNRVLTPKPKEEVDIRKIIASTPTVAPESKSLLQRAREGFDKFLSLFK